ncbi:hypothetical protein BDW59DRAFT_137767 [Aspergillus cavernicola]|uniref:Zn(2)-C6 fungal-type domain-containing protein n=1 Tax=Aspergillus cavernicola TaxID=176166 RepID=A0ABR4J2V5_9EURO
MIDQHAPSKPLRRQRLRVSNACQVCRLRKIKCDGARPVCTRCQTQGKTCVYNHVSNVPAKQTARKPHGQEASSVHSPGPMLVSPPPEAPSLETPPASALGTPSTFDSISRSRHLEEDQGTESDPDQNRAYYTAHGMFVGQVAAAIDVRAGLVPATSHQVPLVDAPLFGNLDLPPHSILLHSLTELPPHAYADELVDIYWRHVDPVEPILDRQRFFQNYEKAYSTPITSPCADYDLWFGILNLVFALAVQRQEQTRLHQRNEEANRFFQRAWALLPAESMLWKPGSLELVQCLMLMNRYLHCTDNQQKTWMTAGLSIRIAQSMCCHSVEMPSAKGASDARNEKALKQKVWASCVALDRCISWSLGKTSALVLIPSPPSSSSSQQIGQNSMHNAWGLELHEIGNQIQLAQMQTRTSLAARFRPSVLSQQDEYYNMVLQLDACLHQWETSLPTEWQAQSLKLLVNRSSQAERYLLHLRYLHHRLFLYRPMLARFYSLKPDTSSAYTPPSSLSHRLLRESASICIETAQQIASLVIETLEPDEPIGLLPWWYRIYYLHIAGTTFLAAMFRPELFTESVAQSWEGVLLALRAHDLLTPYVQQCIWTFNTLAARITGKALHHPIVDDSGADPLMAEGVCFDDIFQDINFDFDNFLFGPEDFGGGLA